MAPPVVGLTGGIGSGKTTALHRFAALGARTVNADELARSLYLTDDDVRRGAIEIVGPEAYFPDGTLDRAAVARVIFADDAARLRLNALIHPRVHAAVERTIRAETAAPLVVVEAALIFESGGLLPLLTAGVIVVTAGDQARIERVRQRDGATAEAVRRRMAAQLPPETALSRATYVLTNSGPVAELERQVDALYQCLTGG